MYVAIRKRERRDGSSTETCESPLKDNMCVVFRYSVCFRESHLKRKSHYGDFKQETYRFVISSYDINDEKQLVEFKHWEHHPEADEITKYT